MLLYMNSLGKLENQFKLQNYEEFFCVIFPL